MYKFQLGRGKEHETRFDGLWHDELETFLMRTMIQEVDSQAFRIDQAAFNKIMAHLNRILSDKQVDLKNIGEYVVWMTYWDDRE